MRIERTQRWLLLSLLVLVAAPARASTWTVKDTVIEAAGATLHLLDMSQTLRISADPRYVENNPILGRRPAAATVTGYFVGTLLLHVTVARLLPQPYRTMWQLAWIGVEGGCVANNVRAGIQFRLP
ncbi:hypothetical protein [Anaeromyxobacter diazotrophicus]|uniref:Uncharacterized protein n=1 Tax=Anaeromyxobacter diazotrophicus TaxID=2590199 RepID=A0A7I9VIK8_9BACT|nr:hypothetical protein [Anaeromyxobacter diazotrophicus]GEJ56242.1 hypothetical protein AMYX_09830 [Anaeromyxobacter diazotrophicus]